MAFDVSHTGHPGRGPLVKRFIRVVAACWLSAAPAAAEGLGALMGRPDNKVIDCLMASGLIEDAAMFTTDKGVVVIGPGGWKVTVTGTLPPEANIDARDASGQPNETLRRSFRAALDNCK